MRSHAAALIRNSQMVKQAMAGEPDALISTFWPFIVEFPRIIRKQLRASRLLFILGPKLGWWATAKKLLVMRRHVIAMAREEGDHSELWAESAAKLGVPFPPIMSAGVRRLLIVLRREPDLWRFLAYLAATEYLAEELARHLTASHTFISMFDGRRWEWGEAHLMEHAAPSHLEMDLDLANACHPNTKPSLTYHEIRSTIMSYMDLFAAAAT